MLNRLRQINDADGSAEAGQPCEADRLLRRQVAFGDDVEYPLVGVAVVGGVVGDGVPGEDEELGVARTFGDPASRFVAPGLVSDRKDRAGWRAGVAMPALARGGLLDLDAERPVELGQVAGPPIPRAQRPLGLQRHRHHLLDPLAADRVAKERCTEQSAG